MRAKNSQRAKKGCTVEGYFRAAWRRRKRGLSAAALWKTQVQRRLFVYVLAFLIPHLLPFLFACPARSRTKLVPIPSNHISSPSMAILT
jgi:hypothetical protein